MLRQEKKDRFLPNLVFKGTLDVGLEEPYILYPRDPGSPCQRMSKGCRITETKRKVFRFHAPILRR